MENWMTSVEEQSPDPHEKYLVLRNGVFFTATPCYGLHTPFWVVTGWDGKENVCGNNMQNTDKYIKLEKLLGR